MRKLVTLLALAAMAALVALPASARTGGPGGTEGQAGQGDRHQGQGHGRRGERRGRGARRRCGREARRERGYVVIFDGTRRCLRDWAYVGGASMELQRDGTLRSGPGAPGLGTLWYAARPYADFSLRLQFRDDSPDPARRANSGVQVRFPPPVRPTPGCPTTFNGNEQNNLAWIAVNCGHEIQINDSPDVPPNDPRKTGSIYGFADLNAAQARVRPKGVWNELEIRVVGQRYTVIRNGVVINRYDNVPGVPFPGRPNDPGSESRGPVGYIGLQAHGAPHDVVSFRNIRVKDLTRAAAD